MSIAHINNIATVARHSAGAQRRLGHEAVVFSFRGPPSRLPCNAGIDGSQGRWGGTSVCWRVSGCSSEFDLIQVLGGIRRTMEIVGRLREDGGPFE